MDKILFTKLFLLSLITLIVIYLYKDINFRITELQKRPENSLTDTIKELKNRLKYLEDFDIASTRDVSELARRISELENKTRNISSSPDKTSISGPLELVPTLNNPLNTAPFTTPLHPLIYSKIDGNVYYLGSVHEGEYSLTS